MPPQLSDKDRWKIVTLFTDLHLSLRQIARNVKCTHEAVRKTLQRFRETGEVTNRPGQGRPTIMNSSSLHQLNRMIRSTPSATSTYLATAMTTHTGQRISPRTIRRARTQSLGFHPVHEIITHARTTG
jgi:transposase